jgi:hypothetical protein
MDAAIAGAVLNIGRADAIAMTAERVPRRFTGAAACSTRHAIVPPFVAAARWTKCGAASYARSSP